MRNLKRLLTMVMAIAMMMSLMVVGAGATAFKDDKDITHKDAVEKMASLNIINGRDNGNFDPTGIVTRAEMAKMIYIALNGGSDLKQNSATITTSFADTKGHWAAYYIEYCVNMGVVAGLGDKTFGPDQQVTATQAAKMLLVALGYDAAYEKFTGATWALSTNRVATQKGLYDEIQGIDPNAGMTRDAAAQMIYNFCYAKMVKYEFGISGTGGSVTGVKQATDTTDTVLSKYYKLKAVPGTISEVTYDSKKKEYGYKLGASTYYSSTNYSALMGMDVEILFKDKNNDGNYNRADDTLYDINKDGSAIIAEGAMTDFGKYVVSDTLKFNGTTYDVDSGTISGLVAFDGKTTLTLKNDGTDGAIFNGSTKVADPYTIKLIDNNDNGKIDTFVIVPTSIQKVTYVGSDSITFAAQGGTSALTNPNVDKKDLNSYTGIAKDDIVAYYAAANTAERTATAVKMDLKSGVVSAVRSGNDVKIDGTWYTVQGNATAPKAGDKVSYAAIGSNIYYAKVTEAEATSRNVLTIYNEAAATGSYADGIDAKVIFGTDGSKKTVNVTKVTNSTTNAVDDKVVVGDVTIGQMYTYKVNSDGEYELTTLGTDNLAGHDGYKMAASTDKGYADKKINGVEIADNATILMIGKNDNSAKKYTGAELKRNYGDKAIADENVGTAQIFYDKSNGFNYVTVATLVVDSEVKFASGTQYGYLTSKPGTGIEAGKDYNYYTVWTAAGEKNLKEQETGLPDSNLAKGDVITYNIVDGDVVKDVSLANVTVGAVEGWDDKNLDKVQLTTGTYDVDKNTTIFNIDSANHKGVSGNTITEGNGVNNNAYYIINASGKVDLIIVDLSGKITAARQYVISGDATGANVNAALKMADTVIVTGKVTVGDDVVVPAGKTLSIAGNLTIDTGKNLTVDAKGVLAVVGTTTTTGTGTITINGEAAIANATLTGKITVGATGELAIVSGTVNNASLIEGAVGAKVEFAVGVVIGASATGYYADNADNTADAITSPVATKAALYVWTAAAATGRTTAGWVLVP